MASENENFDYGSLLESFSIQETDLVKSHKQKFEDYQMYEEVLRDYKEAKRNSLYLKEQCEKFKENLWDKLKIRISVNQLQIIPNEKHANIQSVILEQYEEMSKHSDDFVNLVNTYILKFQNLGAEFHETVIAKKIIDCNEQINRTKTEIENHSNKYDKLKIYYGSQVDTANDVKEALNGLINSVATTDLGTKFFDKEKQLQLLHKDIEYMKQQNNEFERQINAFD